MAHQMAQKPVEKYDQEELRIWEGLSIPNPPTREQLEQISHFQELQEVFLQTAEEKFGWLKKNNGWPNRQHYNNGRKNSTG